MSSQIIQAIRIRFLRQLVMLCSVMLMIPVSYADQNIHVIVALADNASQGITPIPKALGDGDQPETNLYWGAMYGVKTFFSRDKAWQKVSCQTNINPIILERCIFQLKNQTRGVLTLTADAYRGTQMAKALIDFMAESATPPTTKTTKTTKTTEKNSEMVVFVGHNGLMDLKNQFIRKTFKTAPPHQKQAVVLACLSDIYFSDLITQAGATPMVTTFSLMAPEAYVVNAIALGFYQQQSSESLRLSASQAYANYQKISVSGAKTVFFPRKTKKPLSTAVWRDYAIRMQQWLFS